MLDGCRAYDFLESSRWGSLLRASDVLEAAASLGSGGAAGLGAGAGFPKSAPHLPPLREARGGEVPAAAGAERDRGNLTVVALSTHVAVVEPASSLREQLLALGVPVHLAFLGVMHPSSDVPCQLMQAGSACSRAPGGWAADVRAISCTRSATCAGKTFGTSASRASCSAGWGSSTGATSAARPTPWSARTRSCSARFFAPSPDVPRHVLVYLTPTPLTLVPEGDRMWVLGQLKTLVEHGKTTVLAASRIYSLHALYQTGAHVAAVRPASLYVSDAARWSRKSAEGATFYIWCASSFCGDFIVVAMGFVGEGRLAGSRQLQRADPMVKELLDDGFASWALLATMRCVVFMPWDLQLTAFPELYALGVPLVLPTASYIAQYGLRILTKGQTTFWAVHPRFAGQLPGQPSVPFAFGPWVDIEDDGSPEMMLRAQDHFLYWLQASDYETFGHTLRFDSVPGMLQHAVFTPADELGKIGDAMRAEWTRAHRETAAVYRE
ncbi:unnamed protein product, partial [Prorocentrum cordatum]